MSESLTTRNRKDRAGKTGHGHLLRAANAEKLLVSLVNCKFPEEGRLTSDGRIPGGERDALIKRLRAQTEKYWPDLWGWVDEPPPEKGEERAQGILRKVRWYLREFWTSSDPHARDWYIHRLRQYHRAHQILPETKQERGEHNDDASIMEWARRESTLLNTPFEQALIKRVRFLASCVNSAAEIALDQPPIRTPFEGSLFHLQHIADKVLHCPNPKCEVTPYFIRQRQGQKYCCRECAEIAHRDDNREWARASRATKKGKQS